MTSNEIRTQIYCEAFDVMDFADYILKYELEDERLKSVYEQIQKLSNEMYEIVKEKNDRRF